MGGRVRFLCASLRCVFRAIGSAVYLERVDLAKLGNGMSRRIESRGASLLAARVAAVVGRRLPIASGLGTASEALSRLFKLDSSAGSAEATLRNGMRIEVSMGDYNGRMLYLFGTPDPKIVGVCRRLLCGGDVFLDIGANHGAVGLLCRDVVSDLGSVHLVEPQGHLCEMIGRCIEREGIGNVQVHNCGLWSGSGEARLDVSPSHTGAGHLVELGSDCGAGAALSSADEVVQLRATSGFLEEFVGGRRFGAKVDVEGAESEVLPDLLDSKSMRFVLFEATGEPARKIVADRLNGCAFDFYGVLRSVLGARVERILEAEAIVRFHDVLVVPAGSSVNGS